MRPLPIVLPLVVALGVVFPGAAPAVAQYPPGTSAECAQVFDARMREVTSFVPGEEIVVLGWPAEGRRCAEPGAEVRIDLASDPVVLGRTNADARGAYDTRPLGLRIPQGIPAGPHTLRVVTALGGDRALYTRSVRILEGSPTGLPATGRDIALLVLWALLLTAAGALLITVTWRRWHGARAEQSEARIAAQHNLPILEDDPPS